MVLARILQGAAKGKTALSFVGKSIARLFSSFVGCTLFDSCETIASVNASNNEHKICLKKTLDWRKMSQPPKNMNKESIVAKYLSASLPNFLNKLQYQAAQGTKHCINKENYKVSCPKK